jgi:DNA-binding NarL/FixJ family response regulator
MIRLLIAEADPAVRDGLDGVLNVTEGMVVVAVTGNGDEAVRLAYRLRPDLLLIDLQIPGLDAVTAMRRLAGSVPSVRMLALAIYDTDPDLLPAIEAGAVGYLLKGARRQDLIETVRSAARGEPVPVPSGQTPPAERVRGERTTVGKGLSRRELEVLALIAKGSSNQEAAASLFVSEATVDRHLESVYSKLGVTDRTAAVTQALQLVIGELDSPAGR